MKVFHDDLSQMIDSLYGGWLFSIATVLKNCQEVHRNEDARAVHLQLAKCIQVWDITHDTVIKCVNIYINLGFDISNHESLEDSDHIIMSNLLAVRASWVSLLTIPAQY